MLPALYAITNATLGTPWGDLFHGKVTQSGQLTLFSTELGLNNTQRPLLLVPLLAMVLLAWTRICSIPKGSSDRLWIALVAFAIPIMAVTLMINLKRGPWLGSACALLIFFFLYSRRLLLPMLLLLGAAAVSIAPIRTRLAQSTNDFLIPGGRSVIWQIGEDLLMRYPLGVGFKNSAFLQKFSTIIPPELTHFHNNFLNIIVETGWLAFPLFLYWLFVLYRRGLQLRGPSLQGAIAVAAGCALLAWQVAGLVEYNFGDSEVLLLAFFCVSLLSSAALVQRKPL
jgi:O-antigen ligase